METVPAEPIEMSTKGGRQGDKGASEPNVKQEGAIKDESLKLDEVKIEPVDTATTAAGDAETSGRSMRKRNMQSLAENSESSDESVNENFSKPPAKRRSRGGSASKTGTGRGRSKSRNDADVPTNMADPSRNPRIVLKNIDEIHSSVASEESKGTLDKHRPAAGGRGRRGRPPRGAAKSGGRQNSKSAKSKAKEDDEEEDEEDPEFDMDEDDDEDEEFVPKKRKATRQSKPTPRKGGKGKGKGGKSHDEDDEESDNYDEDGGTANDADGNATNPDAIMTGQYLIEKLDMRHLENYPIWRMEGPNMLRKFEMTVVDGRVCHKSLYAYSSWAQSMLDLYEKLQVRQISLQDGETIVEISEESMPLPPDLSSLENQFVGDSLLPLYQIYVRAFFHQAVDPTFLKRIKNDNDFYFLDAISQIDNIIRDKIASIESQVSMKDDFKGRVRNCPNMKSIRRQNWSQTDQATTNMSAEKGVRSVLLFGYGYEPFLMEEDKSKGVEVAQEVVVGSTMDQYLSSYHGLTHFKFNLLRRCQDKVKLVRALTLGLDLAAILDRCLQDRVWILQTFEDLKTLLAVGSTS